MRSLSGVSKRGCFEAMRSIENRSIDSKHINASWRARLNVRRSCVRVLFVVLQKSKSYVGLEEAFRIVG